MNDWREHLLEPLDMAEIELGIPGRQCLSQRIDNLADLRRQVKAWEKSRDEAKLKVNWQFTTADARIKLKKLYPSLEEQGSTSVSRNRSLLCRGPIWAATQESGPKDEESQIDRSIFC